jgi:hypothetical protein
MAESKLPADIEKHLSELRAQGRRLTRFDSLAKSHGMTEDEAKAVLNAFREKYGERVRGDHIADAGKMVEEKSKKKWHEVAADVADWMVDSGTVLTAVIIDLVLSGICLFIMGPSALEKVAFVAIAFIIVLFGLRALIRGRMRLWLMCAILAGFLDTSFVLVGIDYQTNRTAADRQLEVLETAELNASSYLEELKAKQLEKGEGYKGQIEGQQAVFDAASVKASEYRTLVASKPQEAPTIKAYDIFLAIPRALIGHWVVLGPEIAMLIALVMFGCIFWVLQETLYTTVRREK